MLPSYPKTDVQFHFLYVLPIDRSITHTHLRHNQWFFITKFYHESDIADEQGKS